MCHECVHSFQNFACAERQSPPRPWYCTHHFANVGWAHPRTIDSNCPSRTTTMTTKIREESRRPSRRDHGSSSPGVLLDDDGEEDALLVVATRTSKPKSARKRPSLPSRQATIATAMGLSSSSSSLLVLTKGAKASQKAVLFVLLPRRHGYAGARVPRGFAATRLP